MTQQKSYPGRILALDLGSKRIGIAMSDELRWTAQPVMTLECESQAADIRTILSLIEENDVKKVVVGLPVSLGGNITPQTQKVLDWIEIFKEKCSVPVETWDEALTTKSAEEVLIEADMSRKKRKKVIDKLAAVILLQSYLKAHP